MPAPFTKTIFALLIIVASLAAGAAGQAVNTDTTAVTLAKTFNAAMAAFQGGDYSTAATQLESVIRNAGPGSQLESVYFTLGAAYFNLGRYSDAESTLKTFCQKYPASPRISDGIFSLGEASLLGGDYMQAAATFSRLDGDPRYFQRALLYEGMAYKQGGKTDDAIRVLQRLVVDGIKSTDGMNGAMLLAGIYDDTKQPDKTRAVVMEIFKNAEYVEDLLRLNSLAVEIGDRLLEEGQMEQAVDMYRQVRSRDDVIEFQTERVVALNRQVQQNVAAMRANPGQFLQYAAMNSSLAAEVTKAKALQAQAEKLPEYMPRLLLREGRAWYSEGKPWEAIVVFQRILDRYPQAKERESALFSELVAYSDLNQPDQARTLCEQYLQEFPQGKHAETAGYLLGATALQSHDPGAAQTYFGRMLQSQPNSSYRGQMRLLLGTAKFEQGKFDEAVQEYKQYLHDFPDGPLAEEATYRIGVALLYAGKYEDAIAGLKNYLQKYPSGKFYADTKYRLMVCDYASQQYDQVISDSDAWIKEFPGNETQGEVLSLEGDAFEAENKLDQAIPIYVQSSKLAATEEVMNYSLFEAAKDMQKQGKWEDIARLFQDFIARKPDNPTVVAAMYWVSKSLSHQGKIEEAKEYLTDQLTHYIGDPGREAVEQLIEQLAQLCLKRPKPAAITTGTTAAPVAAGSPALVAATPTPAPYDPGAELDKQLASFKINPNATARARLLYARAVLAGLSRKPDEHDRLIAQIADEFKPEDLSPPLLALGGDSLLAQGKTDRAAQFYNELKEYFPNSSYLDYAYVGLGEIAFRDKKYPDALELFTHAADKIAASRVKDATVGEAKTLVELRRYDEARKLFEQVASVREWHGESTAYAVYALGDIESRQGHWAEAIAYYQRVFVLYQRYTNWVARSYISAAEGFDKLGKRPEAIAHLHEMLENTKLQNLPEAAQARELLAQWGAAA